MCVLLTPAKQQLQVMLKLNVDFYLFIILEVNADMQQIYTITSGLHHQQNGFLLLQLAKLV
jgi:hypothetical protein